MNALKKGQIVYVDLGDLNQVVGHEQGYTRPCIIINLIDRAELAYIVPFSTKNHPGFHYSVVKIPAGTGGLKEESYALCHQIRTISFKRISSIIGQLPDRDFNKVRTVLKDFLEL